MKIKLSTILLNGFNEVSRHPDTRTLCTEGLNIRGNHVLRNFTINGDKITETEVSRHCPAALRAVSNSSISDLLSLAPEGYSIEIDF